MGSSDSLSCECGQVLFDVANRKPGETLTCPWCSMEYRYLGGTKVERIGAPKAKAKPASSKESTRKEAPKESKRKPSVEASSEDESNEIVLEGEEEVFKFENADNETVKVKAFSARRKPVSMRSDADEGGEAPPRKKGPGLGDAPGGVFPMLGFMVGFSLLAFLALGALFPETPQHIRKTPWGDTLALKSPWPELIAMISGQVLGFIGWGFYIYRLHLRQKAAAAEAAANPEPEKKLDKSTLGSSKKISIRKKSTSTRETKRERRTDDEGADEDEDEHESER